MRDVIDKAIEALRAGGVILYPTDTVWGMGCDATNPDAVEKIYKLKHSADKKGMLVLVATIDEAARYTSDVPDVAWELMELTDKPLTLILPGACGIAANLVPDEGTIGMRVPSHEFCIQLLRRFRRPLVSTSANISGQNTPRYFEDIDPQIIAAADYVVPAEYEGQMTRKPSSIIAIGKGGQVKIIRE